MCAALHVNHTTEKSLHTRKKNKIFCWSKISGNCQKTRASNLDQSKIVATAQFFSKYSQNFCAFFTHSIPTQIFSR